LANRRWYEEDLDEYVHDGLTLVAVKYLKQGDKIGWGILFPQDEESFVGKNREQLIICYLTVNRTVGYVRVLYQPVGGLYPVVIAPPNGLCDHRDVASFTTN
jgi:hypothetical protein